MAKAAAGQGGKLNVFISYSRDDLAFGQRFTQRLHRELELALDQPVNSQRPLARIGIRPGRIGLMATPTTLRIRLYQQRLASLGWECIQPTEEQMTRLVSPAIALVK